MLGRILTQAFGLAEPRAPRMAPFAVRFAPWLCGLKLDLPADFILISSNLRPRSSP